MSVDQRKWKIETSRTNSMEHTKLLVRNDRDRVLNV